MKNIDAMRIEYYEKKKILSGINPVLLSYRTLLDEIKKLEQLLPNEITTENFDIKVCKIHNNAYSENQPCSFCKTKLKIQQNKEQAIKNQRAWEITQKIKSFDN